MNVVIVGHGPSLLEAHMGDVIDSHDKIVRLKRCQETLKHPKSYGKKTDIMGGSLMIASQLKDIGGAKEYWVFTDSRHTGKIDHFVKKAKESLSPGKVIVDRELSEKWNAIYREKREPREFPDYVEMKPSSDPMLGENHVSCGFQAIIHAAKYLKPNLITLAGFDNILNGSYGWSVTRGPDWDKYPPHRWDIEHNLLRDVTNEYGVMIQFIRSAQ